MNPKSKIARMFTDYSACLKEDKDDYLFSTYYR